MTTSRPSASNAAPAHQHLPPAVSSAGQEAIELAESAGLILDPWQAAALDGALGEQSDGRWSAFEVGVIVPRQNGKGSILEARELAGLFLFGEDLILHSAHEFKTAKEGFRRVRSLIENTPDLDRLVKQYRTSNEEVSIELLSGQRLRFVARSKGSGRGFTGDTVIFDEAYNLPDEVLSALLPTLSARPNPQIWYTSSAPLEDPGSDVLRRFCRRGRSGDAGKLAYFEWESTDDLAAANPGLGIRITEEWIEAVERPSMDPNEFARERMGQWRPDLNAGWQVITEPDWSTRFDPLSGPVGEPMFALDLSPNRDGLAFAVAGESGRGGVHLEVVSHGANPGTQWICHEAKRLQDEHGGHLAIVAGSPASSLVADLEAAAVRVILVPYPEYVQSCGDLFDAVLEGTVFHLDQPELNGAVAGAERRWSGDAWSWARRTSTTDITPLVAVTTARRAHLHAPKPASLSVW